MAAGAAGDVWLRAAWPPSCARGDRRAGPAPPLPHELHDDNVAGGRRVDAATAPDILASAGGGDETLRDSLRQSGDRTSGGG
jgi:hypothetical protein